MPAYVMADVEITDATAYEGYRARVPASLQPFGGTFLVRGGATNLVEGDWHANRVVLLAFDDVTKARGWYESPAYVEARAIRRSASRGSLALVEGVAAGTGGVYYLVRVTVTDPAAFADYPRLVLPSIAAHGGRVLVQGAAPEVLEGSWPCDAMVVLEFPDRAAAERWYDSEDYRPARELRAASARFDALLAEGV